MSDSPDFAAMEAAYLRATAGTAEPNLIVLGSIRKTKAVRRKIGRMIKRGNLVRGQAVFPLSMHG